MTVLGEEVVGLALGWFLLKNSPWALLSAILILLCLTVLLLARSPLAEKNQTLELVRNLLPKSPWTGRVLKGAVLVYVLVFVAVMAFPAFSRQCASPVQLIVATTTDGEPTARAAAQAYEKQRGEEVGENGCRPVNVLVYAVSTAETAREAFRNDWLTPETMSVEGKVGPVGDGLYRKDRSLGGRPHYWIPDSSIDYLEVMDPQGYGRLSETAFELEADLDEGGRLDYLGATRVTPLIWAVPAEFPEDAGVGLIRDDLGFHWARPGLKGASGARLHGAYQQKVLSDMGSSADSTAAEARFFGVPSADSSASLLCRLHGQTDTVALVSEAALYRARNAVDSGGFSVDCPGPVGTELVPRYKRGLPMLDHPLIRVTWAQAEARVQKERAKFESFMLDLSLDATAYEPDGVYAGYRSVDGVGKAANEIVGTAVDEHEVPVVLGILTWTTDFRPQEWWKWVVLTEAAHEEASSPAVILLLVDESTSMASVPEQFEAARTATDTVIRALDMEDRFGLWSYPAGDSGAKATRPEKLVELDRRSAIRDDVFERVNGLAPTYRPTPLREVIHLGVAELEGEDKAMLVVVTDGVRIQDDAGLSGAALKEALAKADVRVRIIAVGGGAQQRPGQKACDVGMLPELAKYPGVECRDADQGRADESARGVVGEARGGE